MLEEKGKRKSMSISLNNNTDKGNFYRSWYFYYIFFLFYLILFYLIVFYLEIFLIN